jgi:hypothetical protein
MRFYTTQHQFYCGIDVHARTMDVCILDQGGESVVHRQLKASPDALLKAIAPYRNDRVIAVEGMFTWDLARRLLCPRRPPFRPRPCPLYAGHPWRPGQQR